MYVPEHFAATDLAALQALVRAHAFGTLITARAGEAPFATHLPLALDAARGELGTLIGHVARANGQWRAFDGETQALAVFNRPHAYVSARWYPSAKQVPTWNYVAVHASGRPRVIDDPARKFELLRALMLEHEGALPEPARALGKGPRDFADIPFAHLDKLLRGIVAFELPIERIEGKRKLSQNKKLSERRALIAGLEATGAADARAIAALMRVELAAEEPA
ncbi:MAG: FMN-binding negative transcriptional regulator [Deltaproteobacteria bacterium]|nr:FMN-binding negative transcriptional regulator [Deltaproteobacteria bacterium]